MPSYILIDPDGANTSATIKQSLTDQDWWNIDHHKRICIVVDSDDEVQIVRKNQELEHVGYIQ